LETGSAATRSGASLAVGDRLGRFEILGPLGAGAMGDVHRARDTKLQREVAIKVLPVAFSGDADRQRRFEREARLLAALNHPNICTIHAIEEETRKLLAKALDNAKKQTTVYQYRQLINSNATSGDLARFLT
jgi:serine/threonine protein kinase